MIARVDLTTLSAERKAALIYSSARAEMTDRLWRAAIGGVDDPTPSLGAGGGTRLDGLLAALGVGSGPQASLPTTIRREAEPSPVPASTTGSDQPAEVSGVGALGPNQKFQPDLTSAAMRTGIPAPAIAAIINAESAKAADGSWHVYSRNTRSSAAGIGQFLSGTWQGLAEMKGTWLNEAARARGWLTSNGRVLPEARSALLALRYDASAAINSVADYARHNLEGLRQRGVAVGTGLEAITRTAYAGHYLGLGDAARFLKSELTQGRARTLLAAQIGAAKADARVAAAGDAATAHRAWFFDRIRTALNPGRFAVAGLAAVTSRSRTGA